MAFEANYKNKPYEKEKLFQYILSVKINEVPCVEFLFSVRFIKKREGNYIKRRNCYGVASVSNLDSLSADIKKKIYEKIYTLQFPMEILSSEEEFLNPDNNSFN